MSQTQEAQAPRTRRTKSLLIGLLILLVIVAGLCAGWRELAPSSDVWTNDAKLDADYTVISPRVSGNIQAVDIEDHQHVEKGQPLVELDPHDYQVAVNEAKAEVASAQAALAEIEAQLAQQPALVRQAQATVNSDRADEAYALADAQRYHKLFRNGSGSKQNSQQANAKAQAASAQREADQANLDSVNKQTQVLEAQRQAAQAQFEQAQAKLERARLDLSYASLEAPFSGTIAEQSARKGAWVDTGTALMAIVPLKAMYITAYYREVDITHVRPGQPVNIDVDAFPDLELHGHVQSLSPATGVTFSPIAADDATGNFTKVVQRLPVRIALDPDQPGLDRLKVGLSVETTIHTGGADEARHA